MPLPYNLGTGHDEQCHQCVYSYGRWFPKCEKNYRRNGAATCSPQCPDGHIMSKWENKNNAEMSHFVCLIPPKKTEVFQHEDAHTVHHHAHPIDHHLSVAHH